MMIFALAVIGCAVFATCVVGLFFWQKSRETGVFLALGASRKRLKRELRRDLAGIFLGSCATGVILGTPLAWGLWQVFQVLVVDTKEMPLTFKHLHPGFAACATDMLFLLGGRSSRRTSIIDVVQEPHTSKSIREVKHWYGWVGIM